jgi:hypothetical protein
MQLTTSHDRRPSHRAEPGRGRRAARAMADWMRAISGRRRRDAALAREKIDLLEIDQRVRHFGEW